MLEPLSKSAGYACRSVRLPQKEALSRERMLDALDTYFEARGEAGLDPFCAELFWPGNLHPMSGSYGEEVRKAPEEAESQSQKGRTAKGPLSWSLALDEKRCAALARIPGAPKEKPALRLTEEDLVFLLLVDEALAMAETGEDDAGLAYTLVLDEGSLSFFGDRTWEILCRFACLSLTLRQGEKTIFSNQYLLTRVTRTEKGYELQVNPVVLAALGVPANEVLADWVALWKRLGERPLPGVWESLISMDGFSACTGRAIIPGRWWKPAWTPALMDRNSVWEPAPSFGISFILTILPLRRPRWRS